jgi:hypothetical protein
VDGWMGDGCVGGEGRVQRVRKESLSLPACLTCPCISSQLTRYLRDRFLALPYPAAVGELGPSSLS